jgi:REP element-mobilizing transposase RayT
MIYDWLLTSTFYGNWLPGDERGFVSRVRDVRIEDPDCPHRIVHNQIDTDYDRDLNGLRHSAQALLSGEVIRLVQDQAEVLLQQFQETATHRNWLLLSCSVMSNHVHWVLRVDGFVEAKKLLGDLKAYGSRALSIHWGKPRNKRESWWTKQGSTRVRKASRGTIGAVRYVQNQAGALAVYTNPDVMSILRC